ncbi:MAG TPA: sugar transferase [Planctomycetaceae bacterium]|nr:sugar transferase [Planctomycetaceae bacterium]
MIWRNSIKRAFDFAAAALGLALLAPILLGVALAVWLSMGRPVFFRQRRPGLHGKPFEMVKFRTMRDAIDAEGRPLPDGERLTRVGRWLRATSLDELPELWNVVRGDMSLVGPRPLLMQYLDRYTPEQARRHEVRPGITGWAQINGRNAISWEERFALDLWYVDHRGFLVDVRILLATVWKVFARDGIHAANHPTVSEFKQTGSAGTSAS